MMLENSEIDSVLQREKREKISRGTNELMARLLVAAAVSDDQERG